jgi:hypothetical protein
VTGSSAHVSPELLFVCFRRTVSPSRAAAQHRALELLEFVKKDQLTPEQESELEHFTELEYILQMAKARARRFSLRSKRRRSPLYCLVSRPPEPLADPVFCPFSAAVQRKCPSKHGVYRPSIQAHHE